jgi:hypothetical protein
MCRLGFRVLMKPFLLNAQQGADNSIYLANNNAAICFSGEYFVKRKPASPKENTFHQIMQYAFGSSPND